MYKYLDLIETRKRDVMPSKYCKQKTQKVSYDAGHVSALSCEPLALTEQSKADGCDEGFDRLRRGNEFWNGRDL